MIKKIKVLLLDLLNIDTEGMDINVLKSNNWLKIIPRLIIVEDHRFVIQNNNFKSDINKFLNDNNFHLIGFSGPSYVYVKS